ncbi:unnamed protein product, partial [Mesorhabditis spiculigera]
MKPLIILLYFISIWASRAVAQDEAKLRAAWKCCPLPKDRCCLDVIRYLRPIFLACPDIVDEEKVYECANKVLYPEQKYVSMKKKDALCTVVMELNRPYLLEYQASPGLSNDDITATLRLSCSLENQRFKCYRRCLDQLADGTMTSPTECVCSKDELETVPGPFGYPVSSPTVTAVEGDTPEEKQARIAHAVRLHRIKLNITEIPKGQY